MDIRVIVNQMLVLFIVMIIGYITNKKNILDVNANKKISSLLLNITAPALILSSVVNRHKAGDPKLVLDIAVLAIILYAILPFLGIVLAKILKVPKEDENLYQFMTIFSNVGFVGFPVIESIFGSEAVFFAAIINLVFNIFCYSYGIYLISESNKLSFDIKTLINPGIIVSIIAIIIYITNIEVHLVIKETTSMIGGITTPLAMMLIGSSLGEIPIKEVFLEKRLYPYTFIKQIIMPIIFFLILKPFVTNELILGIIIIVSAMPVATITIMFCNEYEGNINLASKTIFITTLCSVVTIPALVYILLI
ncbi:AEC family transporter [Terrisporobacter petrolearius]|uniref:AEC family transporter n=1 Tax=Terrisporobacter petrolearius TaxID=1460447 RepID=UPI001D16A012|nr:AEC family transporter [Terrisporobacter petrolearius]MCC3864167.1 AEC family transporter [Terrisporobacter petrolearius]